MLIYSEQYSLPAPAPQSVINFGEAVHLSIEGGLMYVAPLTGTLEYYPTVGKTPATLTVLSGTNKTGPITSGATVILQTTETAAGSYNVLGAWSTHWLYYYKPGYAQQRWQIVKVDTRRDKLIRDGDAVCLVSESSSAQTVCPTGDGYFTTTSAQPSTLFVIQRA